MPRSTNAVPRKARRKRVLKLAKGYFGRRKNVWTVAKNAVEKGLQYSYIHRKQKKRNFRSLWIVRINAALTNTGISYSTFIHQLKKKNVLLNRKVLADLAMKHPDTFQKIVQQVTQ
ncbi:MAG: 50S ribosomal protein L20 [Bacteroidota bacterium]